MKKIKGFFKNPQEYRKNKEAFFLNEEVFNPSHSTGT